MKNTKTVEISVNLIKNTPNDSELGSKVRELLNQKSGLVKESFDGEGGFSAGECTVILAQTDGKKLTAKHFSEAISRINDLHGNG